MRLPSVSMATAFAVAVFLAATTQAAETKDKNKSGGEGKSTALLIAGAAHDAGATVFSASKKDKCDKDGDDDRNGIRLLDGGKHPRPDDCDDDDDNDDCGNHNGHHKDKHKHKDKDKCKSPKK